jgi:hypothetical protein
MLGLLYRIVFVVWKHRDAALIYCRVNRVVPFARELKHLTTCRPLLWIYCFLSYHSHLLSCSGIDGNQNAMYATTRQISIYVMECRIVCRILASCPVVPGSYIGLDTGYCDGRFLMVFLNCSLVLRDWNWPKPFLPNPCQFTRPCNGTGSKLSAIYRGGPGSTLTKSIWDSCWTK